MDVTRATRGSATAAPAPGLEVPASLAQDILRHTGVAVVFFTPDGRPTGATGDGPGAEASPALARLASEAIAAGQDRTEMAAGYVRAAWPIHLRARVVQVAAAEVAVPPEGGLSLGDDRHSLVTSRKLARQLMAAVGEAVRARLEGAAALFECDTVSETLLQSFEEISLLHHLGEVLRVSRPVSELLEYVCGELRETLDAEAAVAYLPEIDDASPETVVAGRLPLPAADLPKIIAHLLDEVGPEQCILVNNYCPDDPTLAALAPGLKQVVLVPIVLREGVRGALAAINRPASEFGSPDAKLIRSTSNASSIVIENRRLYRDLQEMMLDLVRALVSSVDAKDPYTCGHSERVAITARQIAARLNLEADEVEQVYLAGLLHDIGKIGTPEHILRKEGQLEPDELQIMIRHPEIGSHILSGIRKLEPIREAVLCHHERIDGSGYPAGLKGDAVPLMARIVGLADAFDAMTSNRPYRPMLPLEYVKREIERNVGTQFDARVVEALLGLDLDRLLREYAERPTIGSAADN